MRRDTKEYFRAMDPILKKHISGSRSSRSRERENTLKKWFLFFSIVVVIIGTGFLACVKPVSADETFESSSKQCKYYKSIEVVSGDTLWSIAESYVDQETISVRDYVNELMQINGLSSDHICEGQYLTVMYHNPEYE